MKKFITIASLVGSIHLVLLAAGAYGAAIEFLLVGAIPGTNQSVPPLGMLAIFAVLAIFLIASSSFGEVQKTAASKQLSKRRYSRS